MRFVDAVATRQAEVCDRIGAILGPSVERDCPDGSHERRGFECGTTRFDVPEGCEVTVAEVETCYRDVAAVPDCAGFAALLGVMGGPSCAPIAACSAHDGAGAEGAATGGAPSRATLDAMMNATMAAYPGPYEGTYDSLVATYGAPHRSSESMEQWFASDAGTCFVFTLTHPTGAAYAAGSVSETDAADCAR